VLVFSIAFSLITLTAWVYRFPMLSQLDMKSHFEAPNGVCLFAHFCWLYFRRKSGWKAGSQDLIPACVTTVQVLNSLFDAKHRLMSSKEPPSKQPACDPGALHTGYVAYGLSILSGLALPELSVQKCDDPPQVRIYAGAVAPEPAGRTRNGALFEVGRSHFLLRLNGIARYLVTDGDRIVVDKAPETDDDSVRLFLLGSVFGALLHQRALLPLHASAIETARGVVLFAGSSGTGKSALAGAFYRRGYRVVADEICALDGDRVWPAVPRLALWPDAVEELGLWSEEVRQVRPNIKKLHVPVDPWTSHSPLPVHAIYVLSITNTPDFAVSRLLGVEKLQALISCTFRRQFIGTESGIGYMSRITAAAGATPTSRLVRGSSRSLRETADLLERDFTR
jgi:hypothetical protein